MGKRDPHVDAYIARSADFAPPILEHLRGVVHAACPDVEETLKWSMPHFMYQGMLCGMAAFKQHCTFGFWKGSLIVDGDGDGEGAEAAMGQFGRITKLSDLPSRRILSGYVKQAMKLNEQGVKHPTRVKKAPKPLVVPAVLAAALKKNRKAGAAFQNFNLSHRREYVDWITEAKTPETRQRRLASAIEWLSEGKSRNWKYEKC
jgi:uncharacterized protein YdeI (YjbR/CyaY-like superfamily)